MTVDLRYLNQVHKPWIDDCLNNFKVFTKELSYVKHSYYTLSPTGELFPNSNSSCGKRCIYIGHMLNIWGHCITDNIKKLWFLYTPIGKQLLNDGYALVCTVHGGTSLCNAYKQLLQYLDIDSDKISVINEDTDFDEIYVPDDSLDENHHYSCEFKCLIEKIYNKIPVDLSCPEKIYFSRTKIGKGRDYGEKAIEMSFRELGYTIIYPEELSIDDQFKLLKNCKSFASTEGSISHNSMFCSEGCECIVIAKIQSCIGYQHSALHMRNSNVVYIDAHLSLFYIFSPWTGPFFMYPSQEFVNFVKDKGGYMEESFPLLVFVQYLFRCLFMAIRYRQKIKLTVKKEFYLSLLNKELRNKFKFT